MTEPASYSVVLSGNLKSGFDAEQVVDAFARLFKLPPEKASRIIGSEFVIKRDVGLPVAKIYQQKLANIGIEVVLQPQGDAGELALMPIEAVKSGDADNADAPLASNEMICPKCELRQPRAEECSGCGVIVSKVPPPAEFTVKVEAEATQPAALSAARNPTAAVGGEVRSTSTNWVIAALVVAVLGALLWYAIGRMLEYEFGAVAWLIGGALGFAAASTGARGQTAATLCGLLVLLSIGAGKYMIVAHQQSELVEFLSATTEIEGLDMQALYREEMTDALEYTKLPGDDGSLRQFMIDREYSNHVAAAEIPAQEVAEFREYAAYRLEPIAASRPSFDEWRQHNISDTIREFSTLDLLVENLQWMDILFLIFGVGTAFQLVNRVT